VSVEDRALRALEAVARRIGDRRPTEVARSLRDAVTSRAQRAGIRVLDSLVSRIAGRPVHTLPRLGLVGRLLERRTASRPLERSQSQPRSSEPPRSTSKSEPPAHGRFGLDRVVLLIREPKLAFAYWEIDPNRVRSAAPSDARGELRLIEAKEGRCVERITVDPEQGRAYLSSIEPEQTYRAELVLLRAGEEIVLSRSKTVGVETVLRESTPG
jgi:hypothetical protein